MHGSPVIRKKANETRHTLLFVKVVALADWQAMAVLGTNSPATNVMLNSNSISRTPRYSVASR
jgi:hypothetical protein